MRASFAIGTGSAEIPPGSTLRFIVGDKGLSRTVASSENKDGATGGGGGYSDACADKSNGQGGRKNTSGGDGRGGSVRRFRRQLKA